MGQFAVGVFEREPEHEAPLRVAFSSSHTLFRPSRAAVDKRSENVPSVPGSPVQYNGPDSGLSIGATNPLTLETGTSLYKASADLLEFNNGKVTNVNGEVDLLSLIPIPGGSQKIQDYLNSNSDALKALGALSAALGECAKRK